MIAFDDFSGGLWIPDQSDTLVQQAGFAVPSNGLLQADHLDYLPSGAVRGRRGSRKYSATALPGPVVAMRRLYTRPQPGRLVGTPIGTTSAAVGDSEWSTPEAVDSIWNRSNAKAIATTLQTQYLLAQGPYLSKPLPPDAVVVGVAVKVIARCVVGTLFPAFADVRLFKDFAPVGGNQAAGEPLAVRLAAFEFGGDSELWGTTISGREASDQGFGVGVSFLGVGSNIIVVEWIGIEIFYTAAPPNTFLVGHTQGAALQWRAGTGSAYVALPGDAGSALTPVPGGTLANPSRRPRIVAWPQMGKLFLADGVNPLSYYDGETIAPVGSYKEKAGDVVFDDPHKGPYIALHKNRLFATDPAELAYSVYASDINVETAWRPSVQLSVNDDRGGVITGLESYGDALIILKSTCLFRFLGDAEFPVALSRIAEIGCVAPDSVAVTPFGIVFVGREGVWLTDGEGVTLLSAPIRALFVERTTENLYADAVGVYYPRRDQYWLHLTPGSGPGYVLHRVSVPTDQGIRESLAWSRIPDLPMNCGTTWPGSGDDGELYLGDAVGNVWLRDVSGTDAFTPYATQILTGQRYADPRRLEARVNRIKPMYRGALPLTGAVRYDQAAADDVPFELGELVGAGAAIQEPRGYLADQAHFGRFLSVRCQSIEGSSFELHRIDCDIRRRGPRAWG